jgi:predicted DNA-binding protein (UPF0251 family)
MPRPFCPRRIRFEPGVTYFKPAGIPAGVLDEVVVTLDELEALRLADLNGLYQEQAAEQMKISRPTFARIVEAARKKVAEALIHGKALRLEGGAVIIKGDRNMPGRNGKGPTGGGLGMGRGPCGCGQRRGWNGGRSQGMEARGTRSNSVADTPSTPADSTTETEPAKGTKQS